MLRRAASQAISIAKYIYTPLSLLFIFYLAWSNKALLFDMASLADPRFILFSILFWSSLHFISPVQTKITLRLLNTNLGYGRLLQIYASRLPARYLPGGIWHTVGRFADYHQHGTSKRQLTLLAFIETLFPAMITFFMGGSYLWLCASDKASRSLEGILALASCFVLLAAPFFFRRLGGKAVHQGILFWYVSLLLASACFWMVAALSFWAYYVSLSPEIHGHSMITAAATYIFSWGVGYVSIFAPQGIGIFEVVAGKMLDLPLNLGGAIAFVAGFRIIAIAGDIMVWGIYKGFSIAFRY